MIDGPFRAWLPRYSKKLIAFYAARGWTPNQVTMIGFAFAVLAALLVAAGAPWMAATAWWIGRLFDGTDGIYARETGQASDFGGYLDIVVDMASYSVMVIGFYAWRPEMALMWMLMLLLYVLCITSALALGGLERQRSLDVGAKDNRSLRLSAGLAEGGETGIAYTIFLLLPQILPVTATLWVLVLIVTVVARTMLAWRVL